MILKFATALVVAGFTPPAVAGGEEPLGPLDLIRLRVSEAVGRPVDLKVATRTTEGDWTLICGEPVEPSGKPFAIERSGLAASEFGAFFCALVRGGVSDSTIVEFDIGSNDMPAVDWIERHHLPDNILSGN